MSVTAISAGAPVSLAIAVTELTLLVPQASNRPLLVPNLPKGTRASMTLRPRALLLLLCIVSLDLSSVCSVELPERVTWQLEGSVGLFDFTLEASAI